MKRIFLFFGGYRDLRVKREMAVKVANVCRSYGFVYRDQSFSEEYFCFRCSLPVANKLCRVLKSAGIEAEMLSEHGVPSLASRYRFRFGIPVGILLFAAIVFFSGRVVWDIRVDGNRELSEREVIEELRRGGLSVGDIKRDIDATSVENRVMIASDKISWISINLIGTVAEVEIRESEAAEEREEYAAANIVAARDGQIELFEDVRGNVVLNIGDYVREGDLIVSGLYDSVTGLRYTSAKGRVLARVREDIEVSVPKVYDKKVYTGRVFTEKYLVFFEKEIKFYRNGGNSYESCDTIDTVEYLDILSGGELPIGVRTVRHLEYSYERCERSEEEAASFAEYILSRRLSALSERGELVKKSLAGEATDAEYIIRCRAYIIEDIARIKEIEIEGLP